MIVQDIDSYIDRMSLEKKVGQLFLLAYPGKNPKLITPLIERFGICGCYISQDNAETFAEARQSTEILQNMGGEDRLPLLLGVDQEGAWGVLVPESHTGPGNLALGALEDQSLIADMYQIFAEEMLSVGYNALLSPCADTNSDFFSPIIGTRSFGEDYDHVAALVALAVRGASASGILTTLKHFPGHGATQGDTHREIPYVNKTLSQLLKSDLKPFQAGIHAGADIVMTSHIAYPQIDGKLPATLSSRILQELLRNTMGFEGVILSDSMNMGAIRKHYNPAESTLSALKAGVDIVMLSEEHYDHDSNYMQKQLDSLELVCNALRRGDLDQEFINTKLRRIIKLKQKMLIRTDLTLSTTFCDEIERRTARESISLLSNHWKNFPQELNSKTLCINATPRKVYQNIMNSRGIGPNQRVPAFDSFKYVLAGADRGIKFIDYEELATFHNLDEAELLLIVTENYPLPGEDMDKEEQQNLVRKYVEIYEEKCLVIALRSPYELLNYPSAISYLCSYSSRGCSAEEMARLLLEKRQAQGINHICIER